jgi:Leucine-rich repeat (LRR) protein
VLNLSNNHIEVLENLSGLKSLVELNLRKNKIHTIGDLTGLNSLQKLYLSHNNISTIDNVKSDVLPSLTDLTLENNPIEKLTKLQTLIKEKFPTVQYLNLQKLSLPSVAVKPPTGIDDGSASKLAKEIGDQ